MSATFRTAAADAILDATGASWPYWLVLVVAALLAGTPEAAGVGLGILLFGMVGSWLA